MNKPQLFNKEYQKEYSETYKYQHIHTGEYCTFEAYVAEFLVLRRAERLKLDRPGYKFWTKGDKDHWLWLKQLNAARSLKNKYDEEAILSALKSDDFKRYLLIGLQNGRGWKINPVVVPIIEKRQKILDQEKSRTIETIEVKENPTTRKKTSGKPSLTSKLKRLENGKKESQ